MTDKEKRLLYDIELLKHDIEYLIAKLNVYEFYANCLNDNQLSALCNELGEVKERFK